MATRPSDWYWFGDATVHGDELQVMLVEFIKTGDTMWDFAFKGNGVATFDASTLELLSVDDVATDGINWGSAIYENPDDGYTYVYGVEDLGAQKFAHLARVAAATSRTAPGSTSATPAGRPTRPTRSGSSKACRTSSA